MNNLEKHFRKIYDKNNGNKNRKHYITDNELRDLMSQIDLPSLMTKLGIKFLPEERNGDYCGYCPDHVMRKGKESDKPKWYISISTGKTFCHTEGHASNIVEIAKNLLGLNTQREALDKILEGKELRRVSSLERRVTNIEEAENKKKKRENKKISLEKSLKQMEPFFKRCYRPRELFEYFEKDDIRVETIEKFGIFFCDSGYYENRVILPFLNGKKENCGFVAIDILGIDKWVEHQSIRYKGIYGGTINDEFLEKCYKKYRKALYSPGFESDRHLYGFYEGEFNTNSDYVLLVEGERDCLKMAQEGIPCLSIHGTYLGVLKATAIKMLNVPVVLGFDMDEAGRNAVKKIGQMLIDYPYDIMNVYYVDFPNGKDPKKFNREEMEKILYNKKLINNVN